MKERFRRWGESALIMLLMFVGFAILAGPVMQSKYYFSIFIREKLDFQGGEGEIIDLGSMNYNDVTVVTNASDSSITVTQKYHSIRGRQAGPDTIITINGGTAGDELVLSAVAGDTTLVLVVDNGNINGTNRTLDGLGDRVTYVFDGTNFVEMSFSDND